jgi:hypothetical protein
MSICKNCGEYNLYSGKKDCGCKGFTIIDEDGEEYQQYGFNKEDAAIKFAKSYNEEGDYCLMNETMEITVDGTKFEISAEPDVYYGVSEIKQS